MLARNRASDASSEDSSSSQKQLEDTMKQARGLLLLVADSSVSQHQQQLQACYNSLLDCLADRNYLFFYHDEYDRTLTKPLVTCCRLAGKLRQYQNVLFIIDTYGRNHLPHHPVLVGYKGCALYQLHRYQEAAVVLEDAKRLFRTSPPKPSTLGQSVAQTVEQVLLDCCNQLGREPPLPELIKFPRTFHLFHPQDSTAVSSDDKVLPSTHQMIQSMYNGTTTFILEEKVDGANLGISLYNGKFLVQNRSHYISSGEHAQFDQIHAFLEEHRDALYDILVDSSDDDDDTDGVSGYYDADVKDNHNQSTKCLPHHRRYILYGEWLVARHSVPYLKLPGYFMAFDILDTATNQFLSRRRFHNRMVGRGIPVVPVLAKRTFSFAKWSVLEQALLEFVNTTESQFRTDGGPIEGIVLRVDNENWNEQRCKLVRPNFIAGCSGQHWTRRQFEKQRLDVEFRRQYLDRCFSESDLPTTSVPLRVNRSFRAVVKLAAVEGGDCRGTTIRMVREQQLLSSTLQHDDDNQVVLPANLCWLWENEVLLSDTPSSEAHIGAFRSALQVGLVISCQLGEDPLPREWFSDKSIQHVSYTISGDTPTLTQMDHIGDDVVRTVVTGRTVLICSDRGSIAASLLLRFGENGMQHRLQSENLSSESRSLYPRPPQVATEVAIRQIRQKVPGSMGAPIQDVFVQEYTGHLQRIANDNLLHEQRDDPETNISNNAPKIALMKSRRPRYIVFCGLPSSGKSTIARRLASSPIGNKQWIHASTDELGRDGCFRLVGQESAQVDRGVTGGIMVDATNVLAHQRLEWFKTMHQPHSKDTALVFVDTPVDVCVNRVTRRVDHPTIPFGRGERIVRGFATRLEVPSEQETKMFGQIVVVQSKQDAERLLAKWGC